MISASEYHHRCWKLALHYSCCCDYSSLTSCNCQKIFWLLTTPPPIPLLQETKTPKQQKNPKQPVEIQVWIEIFLFNVQNKFWVFPIKRTVTQFNAPSHSPQKNKLKMASHILCQIPNLASFTVCQMPNLLWIFFLSLPFLVFYFFLFCLSWFNMEAFPDGCCL